MSDRILKILLVADLMAVNLAVGFGLYKYAAGTRSSTGVGIKAGEGCDQECREEIAALVAGGLEREEPEASQTAAPVLSATPKPTLAVSAGGAGAAVKKTRKEEILTIPGSGSTGSNDWADIAGTNFYFDTRDYPGLVEVYFEANIRLVNGNGAAYVRLYDGTNNIGVTGSENNTSGQSDVWTKSQKVYFWAGKNLVRVQAKSLTADTAVYNQGRLRVVTEN